MISLIAYLFVRILGVLGSCGTGSADKAPLAISLGCCRATAALGLARFLQHGAGLHSSCCQRCLAGGRGHRPASWRCCNAKAGCSCSGRQVSGAASTARLACRGHKGVIDPAQQLKLLFDVLFVAIAGFDQFPDQKASAVMFKSGHSYQPMKGSIWMKVIGSSSHC